MSFWGTAAGCKNPGTTFGALNVGPAVVPGKGIVVFFLVLVFRGGHFAVRITLAFLSGSRDFSVALLVI